MKCYLALTAPLDDNDPYVDLLEVSIKSARTNTSLYLVALYDGSKQSRCYQLLQQYNVEIIKHEFSHKNYISKIYKCDDVGRPLDARKVAGAFMRLDIPFVETEEEYVLYVDIDVFFQKDVLEKDLPKPQYLAACSEFNKSDDLNEYFNSGVMVMNVKNMRECCSRIFDALKQGKSSCAADQGHLNNVCKDVREWLPFEYNWKPYWGINPDAAIIHFHGMKPGGTNASSGFGMCDDSIIKTTKEKESFAGQVYYYIKYFNFLELPIDSWAPWLAGYLSHAESLQVESAISLGMERANQKRKILKKLFRYQIFNHLSLGLLFRNKIKKLREFLSRMEYSEK